LNSFSKAVLPYAQGSSYSLSLHHNNLVTRNQHQRPDLDDSNEQSQSHLCLNAVTSSYRGRMVSLFI
jgi:hypothetical protein